MKKIIGIITVLMIVCTFDGCGYYVKRARRFIIKNNKVAIYKISSGNQGNEDIDKVENVLANKDIEKLKANEEKVIVLDPGHANKANLVKEKVDPDSLRLKIKDGGGVEGIDTKTPEYIICMNIANQVKSLLQEKGYIVKMTKTENFENIGEIERAQIGNREKAFLVLKIHTNYSRDKEKNGACILVPDFNNNSTKDIYYKSKNYGDIILNNLVKEVNIKNNGIIETDEETGLNWSKVPTVMVKVGYLSNFEEDKKLSSYSYRLKISDGISKGIIKSTKIK